jgi:hypothetical protein
VNLFRRLPAADFHDRAYDARIWIFADRYSSENASINRLNAIGLPLACQYEGASLDHCL